MEPGGANWYSPPADEGDWGYWTVIDLYEGFKTSGVIPDPTVYNPLARALDNRLTLDELGDLLLELGGYASNLEARLGEEIARLTAYGEALDAALSVATTFLDLPKTASEKAKEARALADNPELRAVKRRQIESKALIALLKGWRDSYNRAWETASRKITQLQGERDHTSGARHA